MYKLSTRQNSFVRKYLIIFEAFCRLYTGFIGSETKTCIIVRFFLLFKEKRTKLLFSNVHDYIEIYIIIHVMMFTIDQTPKTA